MANYSNVSDDYYFLSDYRNTDIAMKIGAIEVIAKIALQYIHERLWAKISFGVPKPLDYQI